MTFFRYLKWDDAPCDIQGIGSIRVMCELDLRSQPLLKTKNDEEKTENKEETF